MGSGDGWTTCASGHRHWGLFGAAGLLLVADRRVILQHRAPWTHEGDSWAIPGGARDHAVQAAVREAGEEAALTAADIDPIGLYVDDHGGWSYTTVVARPTRTLHPVAANDESVSVCWRPVAEVDTLRLHHGFAAAWQRLRDTPPPLYLVIGPDLAQDPRLAVIRRTGIEVDRLPAGIVGGGLGWLLPHVVVADTQAGTAETARRHAELGQVLIAGSAELELYG